MSSKIIQSKADLANNGALPAFAEPLHVGRPNIGNRETFMRMTNEIFDRRWYRNSNSAWRRI